MPLVYRQHGIATLTEAGARYYARIASALAEIGAANVELLDHRDSRALKIWCVPGFACAWLASRLCAFQTEYPNIQVELHPTDTSPDFSRYEADIDIRYVTSDPPISPKNVVSGLRGFEVARPPVIAVASPILLTTLSPVGRPADLLVAPLLHEDSVLQWQNWFRSHGIEVTTPLQGPLLWHAHVALEVARRGQGVALANPFLLSDDLETGRLVRVGGSPETGDAPLGAYTLLTRADRWQAKEVVVFRHWLKRAADKVMQNGSLRSRVSQYVSASQDVLATPSPA